MNGMIDDSGFQVGAARIVEPSAVFPARAVEENGVDVTAHGVHALTGICSASQLW